MEEIQNNLCPVCGKEFLYKLVTGGTGENKYCYHDGEADGVSPTIGETDKYRHHLDKREQLVERHNQGKLPRSYYSVRYDKAKKRNVPYLSPKKMMLNRGGI